MDSITTFAGNLTEDPKLTFTAKKGTPVAEFRVAINRRTKDANDEWVDAPATFKNVKVMGRQAEHLADVVKKGTRVLVHGAEGTRAYVKDGEEKFFTYVLVSDRFGEVGLSTKFGAGSATKNGQGESAATDPWAAPSN